jgi:hypothetical protein
MTRPAVSTWDVAGKGYRSRVWFVCRPLPQITTPRPRGRPPRRPTVSSISPGRPGPRPGLRPTRRGEVGQRLGRLLAQVVERWHRQLLRPGGSPGHPIAAEDHKPLLAASSESASPPASRQRAAVPSTAVCRTSAGCANRPGHSPDFRRRFFDRRTRLLSRAWSVDSVRGRIIDENASHPSKRGGWTPLEAPSAGIGRGRPCPTRAAPSSCSDTWTS